MDWTEKITNHVRNLGKEIFQIFEVLEVHATFHDGKQLVGVALGGLRVNNPYTELKVVLARKRIVFVVLSGLPKRNSLE